MPNTEEELKITVEETEDKSKLMDYDFILNTGEGTSNYIITEKIVGCLKSVILNSNKACQISIAFAENPNIIVYKNVDFYGTIYMPLKVSSMSPENELFNYAPDYWFLNNKLIIKIDGMNNTQLDVTLRCQMQ